ncbi:hypothetical protein [Hymenobacter sp. B1770]|uniref:hypothetical protein n=1 Tax=Hymenobacter sp. B1770 TaxID=1718788 RepID=UPI003CF8C827
MQNYYHILGVGPTATAVQIEQAYVRQRARFKRLAAADRIMKARLADVEAGFDILGNARRRIAYDLLLAQEPEAPARPRLGHDERLLRYARVARSLNAALLACFLLLAIDWGLPLREYPNEKVHTRFPVLVSSALSSPQLAYRVHTQHTSFRLPNRISHRVRPGQRVSVWKTPLLGVVRRVSSPASPEGPEVFQPYGGTIYGTFALLPLLLGLVAGLGVWPRLSPEAVINTATLSSLLTVLNLVMLMWF